MIGQFNPFVVYPSTGFVQTPPATNNQVNVPATSVATELQNDLEWLTLYN